MYDRNKLSKIMAQLEDIVIPESVVLAIAWAAEDEDAQEIMAAKKPDHEFYNRLYEFLKSMGMGDFRYIREAVQTLQLDECSLEFWIKAVEEEI